MIDMIRWVCRCGDGGSRTHVRETDHSGIYMHSSFYDLDSIVAKGTTRKESSLKRFRCIPSGEEHS